jgi:hypothetical protein
MFYTSLYEHLIVHSIYIYMYTYIFQHLICIIWNPLTCNTEWYKDSKQNNIYMCLNVSE